MTFVDTSAIYAWTDAGDPNHHVAVERLVRLLNRRETLLTHNYVIVEALALVQSRLGHPAAAKLAADATSFAVEWVDADLHAAGVAALVRSRRRQLSLVDQVSFLVMRRRRVSVAFAFDADFVTAGFGLVE
jgi:predicted nucleic acid-binding protein